MQPTTNITREAVIGAAPTEVLGLPLNHARRWFLLITNLHATQTITGVRIRRRPRAGGRAEAWIDVPDGLPIAAAGGTLSIAQTDDCSAELDVAMLADGNGTTVALDLVGT